MSAEDTDLPRPSDQDGRVLALVEDRLEGAVAQVNEQAKNTAALVAAAQTATRETRTMVAEVRELLGARSATTTPGGPSGAESAAGDREAGATGGEDAAGQPSPPAKDDGEDRRQADEPAPRDQETVAQGKDRDTGDAADDVEADAGSNGKAGETGGNAERTPPETPGASEDGSTGADTGPAAGEEAAPSDREEEAAAAKPNPDPAPKTVDPGNEAETNDRPPPPSRSDREITRLLKGIERKLADEPPSRAAQKEILETLGLIRSEQAAQNQVIAAAVALTPGPESAEPGMPPAWEAFQEVMSRLDGLARIVRPVPVEPRETLPLPVEVDPVPETAAPALPAPAPAINPDEVREAVDVLIAAAARPRRAFSRFAWVAIIVVFLAAGALGGLLQQQYTLLELPDATHGWKDRVWELTGEDIARCIAASAARGGTCAVTVEPATGP